MDEHRLKQAYNEWNALKSAVPNSKSSSTTISSTIKRLREEKCKLRFALESALRLLEQTHPYDTEPSSSSSSPLTENISRMQVEYYSQLEREFNSTSQTRTINNKTQDIKPVIDDHIRRVHRQLAHERASRQIEHIESTRRLYDLEQRILNQLS